MARYPLNLPSQLKREAERCARAQGVSLNQFILWSVAEKVGLLGRGLDDPRFPRITYRRGAAGQPMALVAGTGVRVQTVAVAVLDWGLTVEQAAEECGLDCAQITEALAFFEAHRAEIEAQMVAEEAAVPRAPQRG